MAVEQIVRAGGLECNRQRLGLDRAIDDARRFQIFGEEVIPCLHLLGVDQKDGAGDVAGFGEVFLASLPDIHHRNVSVRRKRRSPRDGDGAQNELLGRDHGHSRGAFRPACLDGEIFGMNAVRARGLECRDAPVDRLLHGWSAGDAAADLVGQLLQVGFRELRVSGLRRSRGQLGFGRRRRRGRVEANEQTKPGSSHKAELEMKFGKRAKRVNRKRAACRQSSYPLHAGSVLSSMRFFRFSSYLLSSIRTVSRITVPTISMLLGLSLSRVSCGVWWKTLP